MMNQPDRFTYEGRYFTIWIRMKPECWEYEINEDGHAAIDNIVGTTPPEWHEQAVWRHAKMTAAGMNTETIVEKQQRILEKFQAAFFYTKNMAQEVGTVWCNKEMLMDALGELKEVHPQVFESRNYQKLSESWSKEDENTRVLMKPTPEQLWSPFKSKEEWEAVRKKVTLPESKSSLSDLV